MSIHRNPLRKPSGVPEGFLLDYIPKSKQVFLCQLLEGRQSFQKQTCILPLFLPCSLECITQIFQIRKCSAIFILPPATLLGCSYLDQNGNALISFTSKFNCGLGPKGGLILATSPLHFYLKIKGTLGSLNRRCSSVGPRATTSNKRNYRSLC